MTSPRTHLDPEQIDLYVGGLLDPDQARTLEAHADTCDRCADALAAAARAELHVLALAQALDEQEDTSPAREPDVAREDAGSLEARRPRSAPQQASWWERLRGWLIPAAPVVVAAAAALLVFARPEAPALPSYAAEVSGGVAEVRTTGPGPGALVEGAPLQVILRPQVRTDQPVQAAVFLDRLAPDARWPGAVFESAPGGALRGRFVLGSDVPLPVPGDHVLLVAVGPAGEDVAPAALEAARGGDGAWQVLEVPISVSPRALLHASPGG